MSTPTPTPTPTPPQRTLSVWNEGSDAKCFVWGHEFGPVFVALADSLEAAQDEWDERHGDPAEQGSMPDDEWEGCFEDGSVRTNDVGTTVWVSDYEWVKEFQTITEAFAFAICWPNTPTDWSANYAPH